MDHHRTWTIIVHGPSSYMEHHRTSSIEHHQLSISMSNHSAAVISDGICCWRRRIASAPLMMAFLPLLDLNRSKSKLASNMIPPRLRTRETATYDIPIAKSGWEMSSTAQSTVIPCALWMVTANACIKGNCVRERALAPCNRRWRAST